MASACGQVVDARAARRIASFSAQMRNYAIR